MTNNLIVNVFFFVKNENEKNKKFYAKKKKKIQNTVIKVQTSFNCQTDTRATQSDNKVSRGFLQQQLSKILWFKSFQFYVKDQP